TPIRSLRRSAHEVFRPTAQAFGLLQRVLGLVSAPLGNLAGQLCPGADVQFGEDVRNVRLHGASGDEQASTDLRISQAFGDEVGNPSLRGGQALPAPLWALPWSSPAS